MKKDVSKETPLAEPTKKSPVPIKSGSDTFEIKIPRFTFKDTKINVFLVFTLVIFAFLLGMLTNKVLYLEQQARTAPTPAPQQAENTLPTPLPVVSDMTVGNLPTLGNTNAKVTVVEFSDFQCPFCKRYIDDVHKQVLEKYVDTGKIQFAFRHFPLSSIHPNAQKAHEAAECANEQGLFWEYHDILFEKQESWSPVSTEITNTLVDFARKLSLNTEQFRSCLEADKYKQKVDTDTAAGTKAEVNGTPTFFVNGVRIVGAVPFSELEKVIEKELKK